MSEVTIINMDVVSQGAPVANHASLHIRGEQVVALAVDMRSKYCRVAGSGSSDDVPTVSVEAVRESLHLDESQPREAETEIAFPEFAGWNVWSAECSRYTVRVCLVRGEAADAESGPATEATAPR